jgi:hypothetical protein
VQPSFDQLAADLPSWAKGVPGVLPPAAKPVPDPPAAANRINPNAAPRSDTNSMVNLLKAKKLKTGLDMSLEQLHTDVTRMSLDGKEAQRMWELPLDEAEAEGLLQRGVIDEEVYRDMLERASFIREQQRQMDELKWQKRQEEESQRWIEILNSKRLDEARESGGHVGKAPTSSALQSSRRDAGSYKLRA